MNNERMLLHICCAPCAGIPSLLLQEEGFALSGFWHGPNIHPKEEWELRRESVSRLALLRGIPMYWSDDFRQREWKDRFSVPTDPLQVKGSAPVLASTTEVRDVIAKPRCNFCHTIRLEETAKLASQEGFTAFTTSLSISPYQDHAAIQAAGERAAEKYGVSFVYRDFRPWYREGIQLARAQGWYIQKYCGCLFSFEESDHPRKPKYDFSQEST